MDTLIQHHDGSETTLSEWKEREENKGRRVELAHPGNACILWEALRLALTQEKKGGSK